MTLKDALPELRRPFTPAAIKMKPQATTGEGAAMKGLVTYYLDARLVVERLNEVVGPEAWSDSYRMLCEGVHAPAVGIPVECSLTVLGSTKTDVGQIAPGNPDDKAWKSAYSDAFKRAAVKFSIGAYLYGGAGGWAPVKVGANGKAQGFTPDGLRQGRATYAKWISEPRMKELFGEPLDHGDAEPDAGEVAETETAATKPKPTKAELAALVELVDGLIADGQITSEQIAKTAGGEWPAVADRLDRVTVVGLTERLARFKESLVAA
jgi:hypothetical protein